MLWGRCYEGECGAAVRAVRRGARRSMRAAADARVRCAADLGLGAAPLARLVPALRERLPDIPEPVALQPDEERLRLLDAVSQFLIALCRPRPGGARARRPALGGQGHARPAAPRRALRARTACCSLGAYRDVEVDRQHPLADALGALPRETDLRAPRARGSGQRGSRAVCWRRWPTRVPDALVAAHQRRDQRQPVLHPRGAAAPRRGGQDLRQRGARWTVEARRSRRWGSRGRAASDRAPAGASVRGTPTAAERCAGVHGAFRFDVAARVAGLDEARRRSTPSTKRLRRSCCARPATAETFDFTHALVRHTLYARAEPAAPGAPAPPDRRGDGAGLRRRARRARRRRSRSSTTAARRCRAPSAASSTRSPAADRAEVASGVGRKLLRSCAWRSS